MIYTKSNKHGDLFCRLIAREKPLTRKEESERHVSRGKYTDSTSQGTWHREKKEKTPADIWWRKLPASFLYFPPVPQITVITTKAPSSVSSEVRDSHQTRKSWYMSAWLFGSPTCLLPGPRRLSISLGGVPSAMEAGYLPWGSLSASLSGDCALSPCPSPSALTPPSLLPPQTHHSFGDMNASSQSSGAPISEDTMFGTLWLWSEGQ